MTTSVLALIECLRLAGLGIHVPVHAFRLSSPKSMDASPLNKKPTADLADRPSDIQERTSVTIENSPSAQGELSKAAEM